MIKVIRYGKKQVECSNCKAILEYENEDIESARTGFHEVVQVITCPVCRKKVEVAR